MYYPLSIAIPLNIGWFISFMLVANAYLIAVNVFSARFKADKILVGENNEKFNV